MMSTSIARMVTVLALISTAAATMEMEAQTPALASNAALIDAIARHGGNAVRAITTVRIQGQSSGRGTTSPIVISGDLNGNLRMDYGNPVTRSVINTLSGNKEITNEKLVRKPPHVGIFAQLDLLSISA
jgi:hypothetical protein